MADLRLTIGALSLQTHCNIPTIRYYEQIGLLPRPNRESNGHRYYREPDLRRLTFIKRCRDFGFPIEQVRELASLYEDGERDCIEVREAAQLHLEQVRAKIAEMRQLETALAEFVCSCDAACVGGPTKDCVIIEDMTTTEGKAAVRTSCCPAPETASAATTFTTTELKRP